MEKASIDKRMEYTAVIRTLGTAGEKYVELLNSLHRQTLPPKKILVYIAEGYPVPKETIGIEQYIYVKKGMVAQRALPYDEADTEFMLFLDDDLSFPEPAVETMYEAMVANDLDVIAPDVFDNAGRSLKNEIMMTLSGRMRARYRDDQWGYKVMRDSGYSYRKHIDKDVYRSSTNAGAAFLCRKADFLKINLEEELWLDSVPYALGEDQAMYYKMHKKGLKVGTWYNHSFIHLDAGNNVSKEKEKGLIFSDFRFKTIFWHRFIYMPEPHFCSRLLDCLAIGYAFAFALLISVLRLRFDILSVKLAGIKDGMRFINSGEYKDLPRI